MLYTFPANIPIAQILERFINGHFPGAPNVEMRCLRAAAHFMDTVMPASSRCISRHES